MGSFCYSGPGCLGCSMCEEVEETEEEARRSNDLARAQAKKRKEDELRKNNKPTLHVSFGDFLRKAVR